MRTNKLIVILLLFVLVLGVFSTNILANSYSDNTVIIDQAFISGNLGTEIQNVHSTLDNITSLIITEGVVNATDFEWIRNNLNNLQILEISGNAAVHSTTDSPVNEPNNFVPQKAFDLRMNLQTVTISSAISIGTRAFKNCNNLKSVSFPKATTIESYGFSYCSSLEDINLPLVAIIGDHAFDGCSVLNNVNLPSATTIGRYGFEDCTLLKQLSIPLVTTIGESAFLDCVSLTSVNLPMVTTLGNSAFSNCNSLTSAAFTNITAVEDYTFYQCEVLENVNIPLVTSIGEEAFYECVALESIGLSKVVSIGIAAFDECKSLKSVDLPVATTIDNSAFEDCESLMDIKLPSATSIGNWVFYGCDALTSINLPLTITSIGEKVFRSCDSLNSVTIPSVTSIGKEAFYGCLALESLRLGDTPPTVGNNVFSNVPNSLIIKIPSGKATDYMDDPSDGNATDDKWYGYTLYELSNDTTLSNLTVSPGTLNPAFNNATSTKYFVNVANSTTRINITPTANHSTGAAITVEGNEVISGNTVEVPLNVGENEINIMVTAEDGITTGKTIVTVTRAGSSNNGSNSGGNNEDPIIDQIEDEDEIITIPGDDIISKDVFKIVDEKDIKLIIDCSWYQWIFDGQLFDGGEITDDFNPLIEIIDKDTLDIEFNESTAYVIKMKHDTELPPKTKLKVKLDGFNNNQTEYLYYYNEITEKLEFLEKTVNENEWAEFNIPKTSIYIISKRPMFKEGYKNLAYIYGYDDEAFRPNKPLSRAEVTAMLNRLLVCENVEENSEFPDINMWAKESINALTNLGIINGYPDGTFKPNKDITRAELAVILSRILDLNSNIDTTVSFTDTKNHWAENAILALFKEDIVNGYSDDSFRPDKAIKRAEAVNMINNTFDRIADETKNYDNPFNDLTNNHWAFHLIMNAAGQ